MPPKVKNILLEVEENQFGDRRIVSIHCLYCYENEIDSLVRSIIPPGKLQNVIPKTHLFIISQNELIKFITGRMELQFLNLEKTDKPANSIIGMKVLPL